jgi:ribose 5-phosphate isomerase
MTTLRIEHRIANYDGWKKAFDSDPINRKQSGVKRFRIYRPVNDDHYVVIDLDFEHLEQAEAVEAALRRMFGNIEGKLVFGATTTIFNIAEEADL